MGFPPPSIDAGAATNLAQRARRSFGAEGASPPGSLVLLTFAVTAGLIVAATAGLAAAHGDGRLVDLFLLGGGVLLAYAAGLSFAPLVAVALVATYIPLEGYYDRLDGDHVGSVVAFAIVFGAAALTAGALGDGFDAWNRGPDERGSAEEGAALEGVELGADDLEGLLGEAIGKHGALTLMLARPDEIERLGKEHGQAATRAVLDLVGDLLRGYLHGADLLHRQGLFDFWVILPRTSLESARMTAERLRLAVAGGRLELGGDYWMRASLSIGIASCPIDGRTSDGVRAAAERALEAAGQLGGNRTVLHSVPPGAPRGWGLVPDHADLALE